ncbi:conserved hypothetical protein [Candidatus Terasakiella magnetica]|nr:conserved hypothetical protein [Candidatus Terasakiella magnetica]
MDTPLLLEISGRSVPVTVRRSGLAQRLSLRIDPRTGGVVVVLPLHVPLAEASRFIARQRDWIAARIGAVPQRVALVPGVCVPLLGLPHEIRHQPTARRGVWAEAGAIQVSGREEYVPRRVEEFLRAEARLLLAHKARGFAAAIGRKLGRVTVRDTKSRWGSCTAAGDLSFSWRLVMAPPWVLEYVAAHEVAHLVEMNHSPAFWAVVGGMVTEVKAGRGWLKQHGPDLHKYGSAS